MKIALIYGAVMTVLLVLTIIISILILKFSNRKWEKEIEEMKEEYKREIDAMKAIDFEKDKLKVEADEKKHNIRTDNHYDNLINGANQLCDKASQN